MNTRFRHRSVMTVGVTAGATVGLLVIGLGGLGGLCGPGGGQGWSLGSAWAEARKAVDAQLQQRVNAAITQGRKLAEQSKYAEAIAAFQSALALAPTTPSALSELGLAHYHLKQYPQAEAALHRALKATTAPAQRGRALYNLGLVLAAKGDAKGAIAAYKESLSARANQVVLERLRKLDGSAATAFDPVAPRRFSGPFPTLKDTCAALNDCQQRAAAEMSSAGLDYTCKSKKPLLTVARPAAPYRAVQLIETTCGDDDKERGSGDSESRIHLLVQSGSGWFATAVGGKVASERTSTFTDFTARELRLTAGPAGAPRIFLRFEEGGGHDVGEGSDAWENEKLVVAGIGPSGVPSATPPLLLRSRETQDPGAAAEEEGARPTVQVSAKLKVDLQGDALELSPASSAQSVARAHLAPPGKYTLVFP